MEEDKVILVAGNQHTLPLLAWLALISPLAFLLGIGTLRARVFFVTLDLLSMALVSQKSRGEERADTV